MTFDSCVYFLPLSLFLLHFFFYVWKFSLGPIRFCPFCPSLCWSFLHFLVIPLIQSPRPASSGTGDQKKQSITTPPLYAAARDPSEPITVLLVLSLAVSFCLVCGCFRWRVRPAVSPPPRLPPRPNPPRPLPSPALLSGVAFKGKETHQWLLQSPLISPTQKVDGSTARTLFVCGCLRSQKSSIKSPRTPPPLLAGLCYSIILKGVTLKPLFPLKEPLISSFTWFKC